MPSYREFLNYQREHFEKIFSSRIVSGQGSIAYPNEEGIAKFEANSNNRMKGAENMGINNSIRPSCFPSTIRELLKRLIGKKVTIVLDAETPPECVEIEAVVGDLLVAEIECHKIKFVNIECICEVITECDDILDSIFNKECCEEDKR